jgi:hypothetical protein
MSECSDVSVVLQIDVILPLGYQTNVTAVLRICKTSINIKANIETDLNSFVNINVTYYVQQEFVFCG